MSVANNSIPSERVLDTVVYCEEEPAKIKSLSLLERKFFEYYYSLSSNLLINSDIR